MLRGSYVFSLFMLASAYNHTTDDFDFQLQKYITCATEYENIYSDIELRSDQNYLTLLNIIIKLAEAMHRPLVQAQFKNKLNQIISSL